MTEWYLTELGERAVTIDRLEAELRRWKHRVRELEDAIMLHRDYETPDETLYEEVVAPWT